MTPTYDQDVARHVLGCVKCVVRKSDSHLAPRVWLCPVGKLISERHGEMKKLPL